MTRRPYALLAAALLVATGSVAACSDAAEPDLDLRPGKRDRDGSAGEDGASVEDGGPADDGGGPNGKDGEAQSPNACPHPEEPANGTFTRIYDPSVGESKPFYINDHTFVRDATGTWHLFGITHAEPADPFDEKTFAHATAPSLQGPWTKKPPALVANPSYGETLLWAPYVLQEGGTYYMFYCGGGSDRTRFQIQLATSTNLVDWKREAAPLFKDGYDARDPMVLRVGNEWVMYYTANNPAVEGNHVVAYRTSTDLKNWGEKKIAFTDPSFGTFAGPTESPFVVQRGSDYYLFIGPREAYSDTAVFHSKNPFSFDPNDQVHRFVSHAAEVVTDVDGQTYVSHSGWEQGGVHLARLDWLPTRCEKIGGPSLRATIETSPRAGLVELVANGRNLVSSAFRRTGPYVGVGAFGANAATAAKSTDVSADGKRVTLKGVAFSGVSVTADWSFCARDETLDQSLAWHVPNALSSVYEVAFGVSTRLGRVRDETHPMAEGDFAGFGSWALLADDASSLAVAYGGKAWQADNRWLSSKRATAAFQSIWSNGGKALPAGDYEGGSFRFGASAKPDDVDRANALAGSIGSSPIACPP